MKPYIKTFVCLMAVVILSGACTSGTKEKLNVSLVSMPDTSRTKDYYNGNRKPLISTPYIKLPVGAVQPEGWLKETMIRQKNGLTGNLGKISAWLQKEDNAWLNAEGKGKWGWEEVPYWLKGYASMAYILRDTAMIKETSIWINGVLNSQRADGNFGPTFLDKEGREDFWPKMLMLYCLQTYYEYALDPRVIDFMKKFFNYQLNYNPDNFLKGHYWQGVRTGDNLHSVIWFYNLTGDPSLLKLMDRIHQNSNSWSNRNVVYKQYNHVPVPGIEWPEWYNQLTDWHNVNVAQGFREPALFYQLSKNEADLKSSYDAFHIVREHFGQVPGGMFGGDEVSRPGFSDPRQAIETCGIVEQMNSDEELLRITGDLFWADHTEDVAFNTYPVSFMPDYRSLRYLTSPNMVQNDDKNHAPGIFNDGPYLMMNPFSSRCCQHNHTQGWPYFTENLWQATADGGIAAVIYAPSLITFKASEGNMVSINEETTYPFEDEIRFKISASADFNSPLYFRIPQWADTVTLRVNNAVQKINAANQRLIRIEHTWHNADKIVLKFSMKIKTQIWEKNQNSISVSRGPLTYSLKIGERYVKKESDKTAQHDSKWHKGANTAEWPSFEIYPTTPWNYGLEIDPENPEQSLTVTFKPWPKDDYPFTIETAPIEITAKGRQIPEWTMDQYGLCAPLQPGPVKSAQPLEEIKLIPMGTARLRISAFPQINSDNGHVWKPSGM